MALVPAVKCTSTPGKLEKRFLGTGAMVMQFFFSRSALLHSDFLLCELFRFAIG
jgi:hypothetical protein